MKWSNGLPSNCHSMSEVLPVGIGRQRNIACGHTCRRESRIRWRRASHRRWRLSTKSQAACHCYRPSPTRTERRVVSIPIRVLHGPGLGPWAGPARSPWAEPGSSDLLWAGPGAGLKLEGPGRARAGKWYFCGPGLGLTFTGLGRARAYSESHSCFNIMVTYYPQLSIAIR